MPCRTMCTVCGFAALSHSYFIRLYYLRYNQKPSVKMRPHIILQTALFRIFESRRCQTVCSIHV
ncbi:hypothetical protein D0T90_01860 [Neisseria animalis]|uniref:Uncharacterized protein n=1 Tax=Neisseria animalis TaxID=492 RepID=A0A5P3MPR5_NEIAN|nr:hypothetical protein D0T90_01860 [Neisseria animalis]ROW33246.1 hypothetical protein CGZ60_00600 [Neisseria animalis]